MKEANENTKTGKTNMIMTTTLQMLIALSGAWMQAAAQLNVTMRMAMMTD
ncbi:MAG TPA: hypothetical protein V6C97_01295 [Oculatellaceae cyanobacterium]